MAGGWLPGVRALPAERKIQRLQNETIFEAHRQYLRTAYQPGVLYRALLYFVRREGKKDGLAYFCFIDIFGAPPRREDRGEPLLVDDPDLRDWMRLRQLLRKKKPAKKFK